MFRHAPRKRGIQYAAPPVIITTVTAYWIARIAGDDIRVYDREAIKEANHD
jgi:hypothetical protein